MLYVAYIDEFGHIGPFVHRQDKRHNDSPVFGLAGVVLPEDQIRSFGTWVFKVKSEVFAKEIAAAGASAKATRPWEWEKKGTEIFKAKCIKSQKIIRFGKKLINRVAKSGGFIFYVGLEKNTDVSTHSSNGLYDAVLREAIKRLNDFCETGDETHRFIIVMDQHTDRERWISQASIAMYNADNPKKCLVEPPFQAESHRYQTLQAADWIAALVGRVEAYRILPSQYGEYSPLSKIFDPFITRVRHRSGVKKCSENTNISL